MREPSASKLGLVEHCAHPWTSGTRWPADASHAGELGNRAHRAIEGRERGWPVYPAVLAGLSESERRGLDLCVEQAVDYLARERRPTLRGSRTEQWIRYHVPTGETREGQRGERREPGWWTAILDHVEGHEGGLVVVRDWKTGRQEYTTDAAANPQMRLQAIAAASFYGSTHVRVELVYLGGRDVEVDAAEFDSWDLAQIAGDLRRLREGLLGGPTPPRPGPWCTTHFCPLRGICPATRAALASVYPLEDVLSPTPRDEAHARWMLERLPGAHAALKAVEAGIDEFARHTPIDTRPGYRYGWREKPRRDVNVDTPERRDALETVLGAHAAEAIKLEYSVSLESIRDSARKIAAERGGKTTIVSVEREALAALEEVGGLKVATYLSAGEYKVKE